MMRRCHPEFLVIPSVIVFLAIVIPLHCLQPAYDPLTQLMSELALGPYGWAMYGAFGALGLIAAALGLACWRQAPIRFVALPLLGAAICFGGAGAFRLGDSNELHVGLIAGAFFCCGLAMYLLPRLSGEGQIASWSLGAGMALSAALPVVYPGLTQRLAAICLLGWFVWASTFLGKREKHDAG